MTQVKIDGCINLRPKQLLILTSRVQGHLDINIYTLR